MLDPHSEHHLDQNSRQARGLTPYLDHDSQDSFHGRIRPSFSAPASLDQLLSIAKVRGERSVNLGAGTEVGARTFSLCSGIQESNKTF
jgi:hypothetical protein